MCPSSKFSLVQCSLSRYYMSVVLWQINVGNVSLCFVLASILTTLVKVCPENNVLAFDRSTS